MTDNQSPKPSQPVSEKKTIADQEKKISEGQETTNQTPAEEKKPTETIQEEQGKSGKASTLQSKGKILLIEDDPPMVKMYSTKLKQEGFEVEVAYDGEVGLKKIKEWLPDLVVLDLMIPKIGGMDLLEQLRVEAKTKNLPVVVLSNLSQEQDIQRSKELGVKEFLVKANFTPGQVVEKIKTALKN